MASDGSYVILPAREHSGNELTRIKTMYGYLYGRNHTHYLYGFTYHFGRLDQSSGGAPTSKLLNNANIGHSNDRINNMRLIMQLVASSGIPKNQTETPYV
jgi:hypothetical protein